MADTSAVDPAPVVTVFLRNRGEVLLVHRSADASTYPGRWGGVSGYVESTPAADARREVREETGLGDDRITLVRAGDPFTVVDDAEQQSFEVHPFLFQCETRDVEPNWEATAVEWVPPAAILDRETVPRLWTSYDRVRPSVATVAGDTDHGSTVLSVRALAVLRDEAALAARPSSEAVPESFSGDSDGGYLAVADVASDLVAARPTMTALANRVNRVMATADPTPERIETAAHDAIERAYAADEQAAANATEYLDSARVATLSRSGTVLRALEAAAPAAVLVAESRPGREGVPVAEHLASDADVTLTGDAALANELHTRKIDVLVVGADSILADGRLVNKVGTRGAALAARHEDVTVLVVTATDKISAGTEFDVESRPPGEVYDGEADVEVVNYTFDCTPATAVDLVVTERGSLDRADVERLAAEHAALADWTAGG